MVFSKFAVGLGGQPSCTVCYGYLQVTEYRNQPHSLFYDHSVCGLLTRDTEVGGGVGLAMTEPQPPEM